MEQIIHLDKQLLVYLNNFGNTTFDAFWLFITHQINWIPFFLVVMFYLQRQLGWKKLGVVILCLAVLILITDQFTNLVKYSFKRTRPCMDAEIEHLIRQLRCSDTYSFFSGHASNSTATMTFLFLILKRYYRWAYLVFVFPLIFAYSRIYLAMHFPADILVGAAVGLCLGTLCYKLFLQIEKKYKI